MRRDPSTRTYVARRRGEGKTAREIIRCLKRYVAREVYQAIIGGAPFEVATSRAAGLDKYDSRPLTRERSASTCTTFGGWLACERIRRR
jgi:hypothetical protein